MSKSFKFKNNMYLDTKGIVHNKKLLSDILYPIGSIYMSTNNTNPSTLFGGTWEQISGRFLYATTTSKTTGGASSVSYTPSGSIGSHTLTVDEIPSHTHDIARAYTGTGFNTPYVENQNSWKPSSSTTGTTLVTTQAKGGGKGHNHGFTGTKATINTMPPWFSVYCWYRTA